MPTRDTETLAEVLRAQLRAYTLPANVRTYLYAEDTHDTMAERAGYFLAGAILGSDWLAARDAVVAAQAKAEAIEDVRAAIDNLPALTEGPLRAGTSLWPECDRDAYSLAIEEAQAALRAVPSVPQATEDES